MNNVSLIGTLVGDPELVAGPGKDQICVMQIEVPRRSSGGELEPGVIYVDVRVRGQQARQYAEDLAAGDRVGVSGTLERDDSLDSRGPRRSRWEVNAHQVDLLGAEPST